MAATTALPLAESDTSSADSGSADTHTDSGEPDGGSPPEDAGTDTPSGAQVDGDTLPADVPPTPVTPPDCSGPGALVLLDDELGEALDWAGGDLVVRGRFDECAGSTSVTIRGACGGATRVTVGQPAGSGDLTLDAAAPKIDGGRATSANLAAGSFTTEDVNIVAWADDDESEDYELSFTIGCEGDGPTAWSLVLDTASEAATPMGDNGWGEGTSPSRARRAR